MKTKKYLNSNFDDACLKSIFAVLKSISKSYCIGRVQLQRDVNAIDRFSDLGTQYGASPFAIKVYLTKTLKRDLTENELSAINRGIESGTLTNTFYYSIF